MRAIARLTGVDRKAVRAALSEAGLIVDEDSDGSTVMKRAGTTGSREALIIGRVLVSVSGTADLVS